jgi:hypothetical protein
LVTAEYLQSHTRDEDLTQFPISTADYFRSTPDYSFRKLPNSLDKPRPTERISDSSEKRPASPISGLNDRMKAIEAKINKYKQENAQFDHGRMKPSEVYLKQTVTKQTEKTNDLGGIEHVTKRPDITFR